MKTTRTRGPSDPPPTNTNITGMKRLRKKVQLVAGVAALTFADVGNCLPIESTTAEIRVVKLSAWASATAGSLLIVKFPIGALPSVVGDNQTWTDEGTQGAMRPAVHLIPNFAFRNQWVSASNVAQVATFGGTATDLLVVDITVEYRSDVQTCPALGTDILERMRALETWSRPEVSLRNTMNTSCP
jgi:hypothetical protein